MSDSTPVHPLIDTHCHLTSAGLIERVDDVLAQAAAVGVTRCLLVGVDPADWQAAFELLPTHPQLAVILGIHPHNAAKAPDDDLLQLREQLDEPAANAAARERIVGVGEIGLDFYYDFAPPAAQERIFRAQLDLAQQRKLPVVIHARESEARVIDILTEFPHLAGHVVFHCFSGDKSIARRALDYGCYLSYTGVVTFKKSATIQESALYTPDDRIMIETDAPYLSPEPMRKIRPNEPRLLVHTARFLADLRGVPYETLAAQTTANAERFFKLIRE